MLSPAYRDTRTTLLCGDSLALLRELPAECVDAVITDPPYSSGGMTRGDRMQGTGAKYQLSTTHHRHAEFAGDNRDQHSFSLWCTLWLSECLRVAKPAAPICLFSDWRQVPTISDALQAGGWVWRGLAVWDKTQAARPTRGRFRQQGEFVIWGSKGPMPDREAVGALPGLWEHSSHGGAKFHVAGKPVGLMREVVKICDPGGLVLDPFNGSGTTGVAAVLEGRRYLGIEILPDNVLITATRLCELEA